MPEMTFDLEWGAGVFLWMYSPEDEARWGGNPIALDVLPISGGLRGDLQQRGEWHDTALNWTDDAPGPWRQAECDRFNRAASEAFRRLQDELGPDWDLVRYFGRFDEDPDLDRYLADPRGFKRGAPNT